MRFRSFLFWLHLAAGLIAGLSIAIMCFTGTVLAFEKEIVAWSERDARRVDIPDGAHRLGLDELQQKLRAAHPDARPSAIVLQNDPAAAVTFSVGRSGNFYANPYSGEIRQPASIAIAGFMHTMVDLHRYLGFHGDESRPRGKLINGVCNLAFCVLAVTGLILWMPRQWSWRAIRPVIWFRQNSSGKARDFNWHNSIGFWTAPILIVLTLTAVPISFRWGGDVINKLTGTPAPGAGPAGALATPAVEIPAPAPGTQPLSQNALLLAAKKAVPDWKTLTLRTGSPATHSARATAASANPQSDIRNPQSPTPPTAFTVTLRQQASWPRTATTTLTLNPYTGEVLRRTGYAELNAAQQVRAWTRFLHTGEAVGWPGQFIAGLACLGGAFLVYTGFALSWRRFFGQEKKNPVSDPAPTGS